MFPRRFVDRSNPGLAVGAAFVLGMSVGTLALSLFQRRIQQRSKRHDDEEEEDSEREIGASHKSRNLNGVEDSKYRRRIKKAQAHLVKIVEHSFTGAMIYVFDKLQLYDLLYENGPCTAAEISKITGWSERWLVEIFAQATAAGILQIHNDSGRTTGLVDTHKKFSLRDEYAPLLRDPTNSKESIVGNFQVVHHLLYRVEATCNAVQTGVGVDYDYGSDLIMALDRKNRNFFENHLISDIIDQITVPQTAEKLTDLLDRGGVNVADVGCGCGTSTIIMAKRFPKTRFFAYETSQQSLDVLQMRIAEQNITNITVCDVANRTVGHGPLFIPDADDDEVLLHDNSVRSVERQEAQKQRSIQKSSSSNDDDTTDSDSNNVFSFVYSHDVLHDMTNPRSLIKDVRKRLNRQEGCWVIIDINSDEQLEVNVNTKKTPDAAINFGFSCLLCLSSGTCEPGSEGLGTMGFSCTMARRWMYNHGFNFFQPIKIPSLPHNSCFIVA